MNPDWISEELARAENRGLKRQATCFANAGARIQLDGRSLLNFSSNDYLDLARHPRVVEAARKALETYGAGATASRLVCGTLPVHEELEHRLAVRKGYPAALVFGTGYMTHAAIIPTLLGRDDHLLADRLAHASILDAARLSRARLHRFRHNDPEHLDTLLGKVSSGRKLIVVESVYSMDGDLAPLGALVEVSERHDALLMVDEAHSSGVFGPGGSGLIRACGLERRIALSMGTLGKGLGSFGGFVACTEKMRRFFEHFARALIYSTAPPPSAMGAVLGALDVLDDEPDRGQLLLRRANAFRERLRQAGLDVGHSGSQIVPVLLGSNERALDVSSKLRAKGILGVAIRPPTVPAGTARLRLSVTLGHREEDLDFTSETLIKILRATGEL